MTAAAASHQADPVRRRRLRWRARRGLLENDLVLTRFFDQHEDRLNDDEVAGLDELLDLGDNELLDLILSRRQLEGAAATVQALRVLEMLRAA
jgi:antitoxin CptB